MTDIDKRIAVEVMGWRQYKAHTGAEWCEPEAKTKGLTGTVRHLVCNWSPSTRIEHAWEVVEVFKSRDCNVTVGNESDTWECLIFVEGPPYRWSAEAETAPLAICRAALSAVEKQE